MEKKVAKPSEEMIAQTSFNLAVASVRNKKLAKDLKRYIANGEAIKAFDQLASDVNNGVTEPIAMPEAVFWLVHGYLTFQMVFEEDAEQIQECKTLFLQLMLSNPYIAEKAKEYKEPGEFRVPEAVKPRGIVVPFPNKFVGANKGKE